MLPVLRHSHLCIRPALDNLRNLKPAAPNGRNPLLTSSCVRYMFLSSSSTDPITISRDRQNVTIRLQDESFITRKISLTPKVSTEKIAESLVPLLSPPKRSNSIASGWPLAGPQSFGSLEWELDPLGDAIHRHLALSSAEECDRVIQLIMDEADKLNHHPHIARGSWNQDPDNCITVTCTTHSPRGLSARDTRLAMRINELLAGQQVTEPARGTNQDATVEQITRQRDRMIGTNRQRIMEALESCSCSSDKT
ncbi:uncharacterized protein Z518_08702 [Rhinocladiella mackenziei CBS 650.93]|uniref:4a-hydroxytetrahydrobiopterin dehydratase n=1 Tax=Rhinocladiella mackenziei CBS 650.93 TaxID=1442369 RepID=A0A0D2J1H4_9EURO|nr:uncharacterized protein Z518_08702 [Rhinocladiella mackenziei CBS 650.93]KIX02760.1 hypothetical protein Z518_08702 [Rhinocladiella mackenziei CBS 650.93]